MTPRRDVASLIRRHRWPEPPPGLRERVLLEAHVPEPARANRDSTLHDPGARPPGWRPQFALVLIVSILLTFGGCTGADIWAGRSVEAEIARLEARNGRLDRATMMMAPVPAEDNRAEVARTAAKLAIRPASPKPIFLFSPRGSFPVSADLRAFAEPNAVAIRMADGIRTRARSNWNVDYAGDGMRPAYMELRTLADAIWAAALLSIEAGHSDDAAVKTAIGLALASSLVQEPEVIAQMVRIAIGNRQILALERLLKDAEPSGPALAELAKWLAENRGAAPMRAALLGELKQVHSIFTRMEAGNVDRGTAEYLYPMTWPALPDSWYGPIARLSRPIVRLAHARYLRQMGDVLDVERGPRPRPEWPAPPPAPRRWELADRLVEKFASGMESVVDTGDDFASELAAAEVAVALRRYRLDRGAYPDDLMVLAPLYLDALPIDPYSGRPPYYTRNGAGFTLRVQEGRKTARPWFVLEWNIPK